jgi:hypothetical protein
MPTNAPVALDVDLAVNAASIMHFAASLLSKMSLVSFQIGVAHGELQSAVVGSSSPRYVTVIQLTLFISTPKGPAKRCSYKNCVPIKSVRQLS